MRDRQKKKSNQKGAAMILVLCVMALFMVLCLSLLYGTSQIMANSENRIRQVSAEQLLQSISSLMKNDLEGADKNKTTELYKSMRKLVITKNTVGKPIEFTLESVSDDFPYKNANITICVEKGNFEFPKLSTSSNPEWLSKASIEECEGYLKIKITVEVDGIKVSRNDLYQFHPVFNENDLKYFLVSEENGTVNLSLKKDLESEDTFFVAGDNYVYTKDSEGNVENLSWNVANGENESLTIVFNGKDGWRICSAYGSPDSINYQFFYQGEVACE